MKPKKPGYVPLERALSKLGLASRTETARWLLEGRLTVNGVARRDGSLLVMPERTLFALDGKPLVAKQTDDFIVVAFNKPRGCVTTTKDEHGRKTVFDVFHESKLWRASPALATRRFTSVGRLDQAITGLLLFTDDTRLAHELTDPNVGVKRTYIVTARGEFSDEQAKQLEHGIQDGAELLSAHEVKVLKSSRRESHLRITLTEGKNREVRRLVESMGSEVTRLLRISYGGLELADLATGQARIVDMKELQGAFPGIPRLC